MVCFRYAFSPPLINLVSTSLIRLFSLNKRRRPQGKKNETCCETSKSAIEVGACSVDVGKLQLPLVNHDCCVYGADKFFSAPSAVPMTWVSVSDCLSDAWNPIFRRWLLYRTRRSFRFKNLKMGSVVVAHSHTLPLLPNQQLTPREYKPINVTQHHTCRLLCIRARSLAGSAR